MPSRNKQISLEETKRFFHNNMTVFVGGFMGCGTAHDIIDEIVKSKVSNLTLITSDTAFIAHGVGKLIDARLVTKLIASHIGTNEETQKQIKEGFIQAQLVPQGTLVERIRLAKAGLGGVLTPTGIGTTAQEGKKIICVQDREYILETPLCADLALIQACKADTAGNLSYNGSARNFNTTMAGAAKMTLVQADEIVQEGELNSNYIHTPFVFVDYIVRTQ